MPGELFTSRRGFILIGSSMLLAGGCSSLGSKKHSGDSVLACLGFKMVSIPGGSCRIGDIGGGDLDRREPVREVKFDGFHMGATEVTVGQFRRFVEETGYKTEAEQGDQAYVFLAGAWARKPDANWRNPYLRQTENHPVVCVSWNDAVAFCTWLSGKTGQRIDLPTEVEWEYACRAGTETKYHTGDDEGDLDRAGWFWRNSGKSYLSGDWQLIRLNENDCGTHPVGMKTPNAWGLFDMTGNVWEWCRDRVDKDYYTSQPSENRVFRGGGWYEQTMYQRIGYRHWRRPSHSYWGLGFRIVSRP